MLLAENNKALPTSPYLSFLQSKSFKLLRQGLQTLSLHMQRKRTIDKEEWVAKTSISRAGLEMVRCHKFHITQRSAMIEDEVGNTQLDQL